jgi:hypothetical protein
MALTLRLKYRGKIRAHIKETIEELDSLLTFNLRHPLYELFNTEQAAILNANVSYLQAQLTAKIAR